MTKRAIAFDVGIALLVLAAVQLEAWSGVFATHRQGPAWAEALGYGLAAAALVLRRIRPLVCLVAVCGVLGLEFAVFGSPEGFGVQVPPMLAVYAAGAYLDRRPALWGLGCVLGFGVWWMVFDPMTERPEQYALGAIWLSPWVIAWLLGAYSRTRRLYIQGLVREREERASAAVAQERNRIARELHDVIGHSVSVMTVQASAVRRLMRPDQARERAALESVEAVGREAMSEMRRMVGVLRDGDGDGDGARDGAGPVQFAPQPALEQLDVLLEKFRLSGLDVRSTIDGVPVPLPPGVGLTAYRVAQEALTNTLKHSGATRAEVRLCFRPDSLRVTVADDGRSVSRSVASDLHGGNGSRPLGGTGGTGLIGMRERVEMYGGVLAAGPAADGGFVLTAELPLGDGSTADRTARD